MSNYPIQKTEAQWREQLGEAHYKILREKGEVIWRAQSTLKLSSILLTCSFEPCSISNRYQVQRLN